MVPRRRPKPLPSRPRSPSAAAPARRSSRSRKVARLPSLSLPDPALELRTRYLPGHERALLGADFFDALPLADGTVALLIGVELTLLALIRDNLTLNIIMLVHPMDWLREWQAAG